MKKLLLLSLLLLSIVANTLAQSKETGAIKIKITDAQGAPLPFASVLIRKVADSSLVKGEMSDANGHCAFEKIATGHYFVQVSQMGYTTSNTANFKIDAQHTDIDLKTMILSIAPKSLQAVNVTAQKPFIERSEGKTILNVESSVAAAGNTALDLLRRAPGVSIDKDENIVLKGKQGVTVMLDGKLTYLTNEALTDLLKNMPAETISQIEIITSPSAKYDAAGTSGIINIKTKKGQLTGINGSVNLAGGGGRYLFYNVGGNINWRTKKFNLFANVNYGDRQGYNTRGLDRKTGGDVPLQFRQDVFQTNDFMNRYYKAGIDYNLTEKQSIGVMVNGYNNAFWRQAPSATQIGRQGTNVIDSILYTGIGINNRFNSFSANLNYKWKIDTSGSEFTIDADYARFDAKINNVLGDSVLINSTKEVTNKTGILTRPSNLTTIKSIKADLVRKVGAKSKIEAGFKASFASTENFMRYDSLQKGAYIPVPSQYDQFIYDEDILAGYLIYKHSFKKTDIVVGLRLEQTNAEGNSISMKNKWKRSYLDYFPNASIDHKINDKNKLMLSYNKRINRPNYGQLNEFIYFLDKYTYFRGNSALTPEYTHNVELGYTFKDKYIATLGYSRTNDLFDEWLLVDEKTKVTTSTSRNLGTQETYSLNLTLPFDPVKWWNSSNNVGGYYNYYNINDPIKPFTRSAVAYSFNSTNTFTLPKDYKLELSGWYESPNVYSIWRAKAMWSANIGVQKTVLQKKGTIKVNLNDIFASNRFRATAEYNDVYLRVNNRWQNRTLNVSFTYRFGNNKIETKERQGGNSDESKRAGG
ncbi:TonB-dependent receptor [Chitinophaga pendula]|uniref:TonB-dependent receptor domain-containing protein n=1 Tax=Chitinophaga TaxID=79328 RepID=UPI000BB01FDF|nr:MULTISPECIES: TonB-dependent receptor [Chitinophaga]ASZ14121.1 hypothetical protein CK934_25815 [Chitinophaga sp. MD30]UCJ08243.1 TonB-dependent receptor [Chitinophaga pendula]